MSSVTRRCVWVMVLWGGTDRREETDCLCQGSDTNLFSWWEMIHARANFKLCELNSCYQRQWWVSRAQLEGPDKTCIHLCFHAFHVISTVKHCKMFNNDEVLMIDRTEVRVGGRFMWSCSWVVVQISLRLFRCHVQQLDRTSNINNMLACWRWLLVQSISVA